MSRREELEKHAAELWDAISTDGDPVECADCGAIVHKPAKMAKAELAAVLRERRQTLGELEALTAPDANGEQEDDLAEARNRRNVARGKSGTDDTGGGGRRSQPRRRGGRSRGS